MPLYTFYTRTPDGVSLVFEAVEMPDDAKARDFTSVMLDRHLTASLVEIWSDNRPVASVRRRPNLAPLDGVARWA